MLPPTNRNRSKTKSRQKDRGHRWRRARLLVARAFARAGRRKAAWTLPACSSIEVFKPRPALPESGSHSGAARSSSVCTSICHDMATNERVVRVFERVAGIPRRSHQISLAIPNPSGLHFLQFPGRSTPVSQNPLLGAPWQLPSRIRVRLPSRCRVCRVVATTIISSWAWVCSWRPPYSLVGFAPSYYLAGLFRAPLPSTIVHVHGAVFTGMDPLFYRADITRFDGARGHSPQARPLRIFLGLSHGNRGRHGGHRLAGAGGSSGPGPLFFYIIPLSDMLVFAPLICFAYRARRDPAAHKRLILARDHRPADRRHRALVRRLLASRTPCTPGW